MNKKQIANIVTATVIYGLFCALLWPFRKTLLVAALFAFAIHPLALKLSSVSFKKRQMNYFTAVSVLLVGFVSAVVMPFVVLIFRLVDTFKDLEGENLMNHPFVQNLSELSDMVMTLIKEKATLIGVTIPSQFNLKNQSVQFFKSAVPTISSFVADIPEFLFYFVLFIVLIFYFLSQRHLIKNKVMQSRLFDFEQVDTITNILQSVCSTVLVSTIVISAIQSVIISLAALSVGYNEFLIIFMSGFFFAFMPMLGTLPVSVFLIIYSLVNGHYIAVVVLAIAAVIAGSIDNIIRSWIFSSQEDSVDAVLSFLTIIGSLALFGLLGLFLGPIIAALAVKVSQLFLSKPTDSPSNLK